MFMLLPHSESESESEFGTLRLPLLIKKRSHLVFHTGLKRFSLFIKNAPFIIRILIINGLYAGWIDPLAELRWIRETNGFCDCRKIILRYSICSPLIAAMIEMITMIYLMGGFLSKIRATQSFHFSYPLFSLFSLFRSFPLFFTFCYWKLVLYRVSSL